MPPNAPEDLSRAIETLYGSESGRILATLVRLLGDLDLAEEAMHEAFAAALETWPQTGLPDKPRPWLMSAGRFKAIDVMRRRGRFDVAQSDLALQLEARVNEAPQEEEMEDDRLRLIFTCCHPALPSEGQVALTLREVCGLTTEEIARAFLVTPATLAQRIVRAKAVIRDKAIPYQVPVSQELSARLGAVLQVVYLVFNAGYSAEATGAGLSREAIRLGRLLLDLLPEPEVMGLLGLMLLQESRRAARSSAEGELILLGQQDRSLWNRDQIVEGIALTESALRSRRFGAYTLQAAIAAVHAEASTAGSTDWRQIVALYDRLIRIQISPVVELNRAVAVAMCEGPEEGPEQRRTFLSGAFTRRAFVPCSGGRGEPQVIWTMCSLTGRWRTSVPSSARRLGTRHEMHHCQDTRRLLLLKSACVSSKWAPSKRSGGGRRNSERFEPGRTRRSERVDSGPGSQDHRRILSTLRTIVPECRVLPSAAALILLSDSDPVGKLNAPL